MKKVTKITDKVYVIPNAIIEFGDSRVRDVGFSNDKGYGLKGDHVPWGEKDSILHEMHALCCSNPTKWRLMATRRDFVIGKGLKVEPETPYIKEYFKRFDLHELLSDAALQLEFCSRFFVKITLAIDYSIADIELIDVFHCRPREKQDGESKVSAYIINGNFGNKKYRKKNDIVLPAFDFKNPKKYVVSILDVWERLPGQVYHPFGLWWGTKGWTKVANKVPDFHESGLDNGYNIKYHVSIPDNYFEGDGLTKEEEEELKNEVCAVIHETLSGKTDSVLFTFHAIDVNGKEISGVKVTPLKNYMSDDAYTTIFNTANSVQASAHGISPILAGIDTGSKLGGSGKELEVAANYLQAFLTLPSRKKLLRLIEAIALIEGWSSDLKFEFENVKLYNYDVTPANADTNLNN